MDDLSNLAWSVLPDIVMFLGCGAVYLLGLGLMRRI